MPALAIAGGNAVLPFLFSKNESMSVKKGVREDDEFKPTQRKKGA
jgi:hypothetical protein